MLNQSSQMGPRRKGKSSSSMRAGVIPLSPVALVILCAFTFLLGWNSVVLVHLVEQQHSVSANSPGTTSSSSNQASLFPAANANLLADHQLGHASSPLLRGGKIVDPSSVSSFNHSSLTLLPPSIWATRKLLGDFDSAEVSALLSPNETERALSLCGKFMYSSLDRAIYLKDMGHDAFVATGDIDAMWTRDSVVQMSIYLKHISSRPWLRFIVEGAIRRNAFNIIQDPYANAYEHKWKDPSKLDFKDQVIGRGGFVSTRNYELDSGAYFLTHLYDYQFSASIYRPEALLGETMVFEAVETLVNLWILEQNHDKLSPYRYFELPNEGQGSPTGYTGMTWTGFRPSDDACKYGYLIPANIHAAGALQRVLILNDRIWRSDDLARKVSKLLSDIEEGINKYGIVKGKSGEPIYAYEVDGLGHSLTMFDDSNVPSLLSIPLLGWDGYNREAYLNTRNYLLSKANTYYFEGSVFKGIGSPHTPAKVRFGTPRRENRLFEYADAHSF